MKAKRAQYLAENMGRIARRDRVLLNNPVIMQGMGLAPLVVAAYSGRSALILSAAVLLLLTPTRVVSAVLARFSPYRFRAIVYSVTASVLYIGMYLLLRRWFETEQMVNIGIYLPMLVVEPLLTYRFGRVQETVHKAVSKGVRITVGYALLLLVVGVVREWLSLGTVFGAPVGRWALLPLAKMPAGGFIVLGILCAIWRAAAAKRKEYLKKEARDTLTVHYQKEGNREP